MKWQWRTMLVGMAALVALGWTQFPGKALALEIGGEGESDTFISQQSYSSMPGLVALIGQEAMEQLHHFFAAAPVVVEPFVVLDEASSRQKVSVLGATLADQMAAVLSNEAISIWRPWTHGGEEQRVTGRLQEMDGYLRVHISGVNFWGERRAYVVNVEMSESVYRALHSYVFLP